MEQQGQQPAGRSVAQFCRDINIGRTMFYGLPVRPLTVKIGDRTIVRESGAEYLARVAKLQGKA